MDIFVARQPILDSSKRVVAYELLFRSGTTNYFDDTMNGDNATHDLVANSLVFLGINALTGGKKAFINFTESTIKTGIIKLLPKNLVAVEILETVRPNLALLSACTTLRELGYQLVLDDFVYHPKLKPLIDLADIIKIDFLITTEAEERKKVREMIPTHIKLLAEKVETEDDFRQGLAFGYEYFQGYFFCKPDIISQKALPVATLSQILLIKEINGPDFEINGLEKIINHDVSLAHKLLKYINSPGIGIPTKITSIKQAITLLGRMGMRNWINIIALRELSSEKPPELYVLALVRGKLCELIASTLDNYKSKSNIAFLVGMFSLLDGFLDRSMDEILAELNLATEIEEALLGKDTELAAVLLLAITYDKGDWLKVSALCKKYDILENRLSAFYQQSICWANTLTGSL